MSGKNRSRQKGDRNERAIVNKLKAEGIDAKRTPLSGAVEGFAGDVTIDVFPLGWLKAECKERGGEKSGFKQIYKWLADNDFLFIKETYREQLVVMKLDLLIELIHTLFPEEKAKNK